MEEQFLSLLVIVVVIVAPIMPAVLIFKLLPDKYLGTAGGNAKYFGVTVNAAGGIAVYFIILGSILLSPLNDLIPRPLDEGRGYWIITGTVNAYDSQGKRVQVPADLTVAVLKPYPAFIDTDKKQYRVRVPSLTQQDWPHIAITYPQGKGGTDLDFATEPKSSFSVDRRNRRIEYHLRLPPPRQDEYNLQRSSGPDSISDAEAYPGVD